MATYYWVGGSGNWDATSTTNWATSSGGTGGAGVPTSVDNVIFDAGSDAGGIFTVTIGTGAVCNDITAGSLDFTMTLAGSAAWSVYGSLFFPATNFTRTYSGSLTFRATSIGHTITSNGVQLTSGLTTFSGANGEWTLGSSLICATLNISLGTLDVSASNYSITISNNFNITTGNLNARNNTITMSAGSATFAGGDKTFYNVSFTNTAAGTATITGANTFNDLTFTSKASLGNRLISIGANQTVNGTLTFGAANTAIIRVQLFSDVVGTARTITLNGTLATLADVDFRDITAAGTVATPWTGTRLGNGGNVTNITTATAKNVYRVGTGDWSATQWALTSGGAVAANNFPLAQDTVFFDTGTTTGTHTINSNWWIGTLDMSALNVAVTLATGAVAPTFYGNVTLDADVTLTGTNILTFSGAANQTVISAGKTWTQPLTVNKPTTTSFLLGDALTTSGNFTLTQGTLDLNGYDLTCLTFSSSNSNTRSIAFGTKKIVVTGNNGTIWNVATAENFSYTGTSQVDCTYSGSTGTRTINHNTTGTVTQIEEKALNFNINAGTDIIAPASGAPSFNNLNFTGFSGTLSNISLAVCNSLIVSTGMTLASGSNTMFFSKTTGTCTITSNGKIFDFPVTLTRTGVVRLEDALTLGSSRTFTLTQGTLDLNGYDLTCGIFSSNNSNTRSIAFGSNKIVVTAGNGSNAVNFQAANNFTYTGTSRIDLTYSGSQNLGVAFGATGATESNVLNFNVTAGTYGVDFGPGTGASGFYGNINFTGFSGTLLGVTRTLYGDLTISSGMTVASSSLITTFGKSSGTQTITTNGKTLDIPITKTAAGTLTLGDNLTVGSTRTFTLTQGTLNVDGKTLSTGLFSSSNSNVRTLNLGANGKITVTGSGTTAWNAGTSTNLTLSGTGTVELTSASAKTFAGGSKVYPYTLNQGGTGTLTITGSNTFEDMTNTVQPTTITFTAGTTTSVKDFSVSGIPGSLVTLNSSSPGTQWNLAKV